MGEFRLAGAYVEARMDRTKLDADIARLKQQTLSVKVRADLDAGAANTRIAALVKARRMKVGVDLDDKAAVASLLKLGQSRTVKLTVDLEDRAAVVGLTRLTADRQVGILANLDDRAATASLTRLTRDRSVRVGINLDQSAMAALSGRTYTAQILPQINAAAYQRVVKALDKLTADRNIIIRPQVDTRVAADELRNLTRRQRVRIGVDVDTRVAADEINNLTRRRTASVVANASTTEARARLDALARNRHMDIDVGVRGGGLSALTGGGAASAGLGLLSSRIAKLAAAAIVALPTVLSLGESLIQMGPAAAVAVPAVLSLATAFAAIKIGTSGIGDAFKAAFAPAASSGAAAASSMHAVENAQRSLQRAVQAEKDAEVNAAQARVKAARDIADAQQNLKNTVQDVADANRRATEQVASAERDLTQAQRAARQAQLDLTQARKDAAEELQDLNNRLADAQLNQRQDVLDLQDAEQNLAAVKAKGAAATQEEIDKAQLGYDQAVQQLAEQQTETQRLQDQTAAANQAGVEGSDQVTQAKQGIANANQDVADKTQALTDAEIEAARAQQSGAQQIAKAQRDVADAQAAATQAAVDGARQIADAQDAVIQATEALADAQASGAASANKLADAMAKLSPNARAFVNAVIAMRPAWTALKLDVQDRLFRGLGASFTTMANASLPSLRAGLVGTAGVLNTMAKNAMAAVTNLAKTGTLRRLFDGLTGSLKPLSKVPGQFVTALAQIGTAAAPAFTRLTTAAGGFATRLSQQLTTAFENGHLEKVIDQALDIAKAFGHVIGDAFGILGNIMKAAGTDALGTIGELLKEFRKITAMPEVQTAMKNIFQMINAFAKLLSGALGTVFTQLVTAIGKLAPTITTMLNSLGNIAPLLGGILLATNPILGVFVLLAPVIGQLIKPIAGIVTALGPLLKTIASLFALIGPALVVLIPPIQVLVEALGGALKPIVAALGPVVVAAAKAIGALVLAAAPLLPVVGQMIAALGPILTPILGIIGELFGALAPVLAQLGKSLLPPFLKITQTLAGVFEQLQPVLGAALEQLGSQGLVPIVAALGVVISDLVDAYANQFVDMFQQLLPIIPVLIPVVIQLAQSLAQILLAVAPLLPQVMLLSAQLITELLPAILPLIPPLATLTTALLTLATGTIAAVVMPILSGLVSFMGGLFDKLKPAIDAITGVTKAIAAAFQWLFDILIGHSIIPDLVTGIIGWFTTLWTRAKAIFDGLRRDVVAIWTAFTTALRQAWNTFWTGLSGAITAARTWIGSAFSTLRTAVTGTWSGLWGAVSSKFTTTIGSVRTGISNFAIATKKVFTDLRDSLGTIWNGITGKFASPIRYVVNTVYNNGIRKMWDTIASKVGLPQLPTVKLGFNTGGVVPGEGRKDTVPAMLTPGERILSLTQVAQMGGHAAIDRMVGRNDNTGPRYGIGGIVGSVVGGASKVASGAANAVGSAAGWVKDIAVGGLEKAARAAIKAVVQPLIDRIPTGGTAAGALIKGAPTTILGGILKTLGAKDKQAAATGQISYKAGAGVAQWASVITQALGMLGQSPGWLGTVERRMNQESGGNPNIVNKWDSNWKAGTPSVGLMQVIGPTFRSNAGPFGATGPFSYGTSVNPLANTYAGLRYALHRYGSLSALNRPGGYDSGGLLQPGATMAVNRTGRPERVLTADHTAKLDAMLSNAQGLMDGGGVTVNMTVNSLTMPTPAERRAWATAMAKDISEALRKRDRSLA